MTRDTFYVGRETSGGTSVQEHAWVRIEEILESIYGGFTMVKAVGAWAGHTELTSVYTCLTDADDYPAPQATAATIARICSQTSVLWTSETVDGGFAS